MNDSNIHSQWRVVAEGGHKDVGWDELRPSDRTSVRQEKPKERSTDASVSRMTLCRVYRPMAEQLRAWSPTRS